MKRFALILVLAAGNALPVCAQNLGWPDPLQQQTYTPHRAFSTDPTGANHDFRIVAPGAACGLSGFVGRQKGETPPLPVERLPQPRVLLRTFLA